MKELEALPGLISVTPVGSRVTCNPPPTDTDLDLLVLVDICQRSEALAMLSLLGFGHDGSDISDKLDFDADSNFKSYSRGEVNLIVTCDEDFHQRFLAASSVAKRLNLLKKDDRVALFQAVLYGNACEDFS
jgi:hypothetical protein